MTAIRVSAIAAERRDFDADWLATRAQHTDHTECHANSDRSREYLHDFFGPRRSGDVIVLRRIAAQQIAHAAADEQSTVAVFGQAAPDNGFGEIACAVGHVRFKQGERYYSLALAEARRHSFHCHKSARTIYAEFDRLSGPAEKMTSQSAALFRTSMRPSSRAVRRLAPSFAHAQ